MRPQTDEIRSRLCEAEPDLELLSIEEAGRGSLRILIDRPEGVDLETCQRVTDLLGDLRERYSLEVSSPGPERPLTRPEHYARFEGRRAKLTTRDKIDGRRNFIGTIIGSDEEAVTLGFDETVISIPFGEIEKARLAPEVKNAKGSE
ncbi:MAG: ribosome maturation factor RimP [Solirubrobacterales bacterium]|nr:ribosome maturation factor RimP [Solirubrobacterales bacterium]